MIGPIKMHNSTNFFCAIRLSFPRTFSSELMIFSHIIIENYFFLPYFQVLHDIGPDTLVILLESFHIRLDLLFVALSCLIILDIILDIF